MKQSYMKPLQSEGKQVFTLSNTPFNSYNSTFSTSPRKVSNFKLLNDVPIFC